MPDRSIHLIPFAEIVAALVAVLVIGSYAWRGVRRRRRARIVSRNESSPRLPQAVA